MPNVVFVAPYFGANIVHCLEALAQLQGVRLGIVTQEPATRVPPRIGKLLAGHYHVHDCLDTQQLVTATRAFQKEWGKVDRLLGYMEEMQLPLAVARQALGIPGMNSETARNFRDKNRMKEILGRAGLPVARQAKIASTEDAFALIAEVGYPVVLKPLAGVGTRDTMRVSTPEELYTALERLLPSKERPVQGEEFVTGDEHTLETISIRGKAVWQSSTYYLPGPLAVVENPWMQYCVLLTREQLPPHAEEFSELNARALTALGMQTGLSHMEWFDRPGARPVISEVAARPPGVNIMTMIGLAHGVNMWAKWAQLMVYETFEIPERQWACGSAFFRGQGPGRVISAVDGLTEVLAELGGMVAEAHLPKIGMPRSSHYEGEGWVILKHRDTDVVVEALKRVITRTVIKYK